MAGRKKSQASARKDVEQAKKKYEELSAAYKATATILAPEEREKIGKERDKAKEDLEKKRGAVKSAARREFEAAQRHAKTTIGGQLMELVAGNYQSVDPRKVSRILVSALVGEDGSVVDVKYDHEMTAEEARVDWNEWARALQAHKADMKTCEIKRIPDTKTATQTETAVEKIADWICIECGKDVQFVLNPKPADEKLKCRKCGGTLIPKR